MTWKTVHTVQGALVDLLEYCNLKQTLQSGFLSAFSISYSFCLSHGSNPSIFMLVHINVHTTLPF